MPVPQGPPKQHTGEVYGRLTVLSFHSGRQSTKLGRWLCQCSCGSPPKPVVLNNLLSGKTTSCGCFNQERRFGLRHDFTGRQFGRWTVVRFAGRCTDGEAQWLCVCACGTERPVRAKALHTGGSSSCGCLLRERSAHLPEVVVGGTFGHWVVLRAAIPGEGTRKIRALCRCVCGQEREVAHYHLQHGTSLSCGCKIDHSKSLEIARQLNKARRTRETLAHRIWNTYRHGALNRGFSWGLSKSDVFTLVFSSCHYCGTPPSQTFMNYPEERFRYTGIDRKDNTRGYEVDNVVPCCTTCNMMKVELPYEVFVAAVLAIAAHQTQRQQAVA